MLKLSHDKDLPEAFNVTKEETQMLKELVQYLVSVRKNVPLTWAVQRLWIDERFSDNLRALSIYLLGYSKCLQDMMKGGTEEF